MTTPLLRRDVELVPASWDEATHAIAHRSRELLASLMDVTWTMVKQSAPQALIAAK